MFPSATPSSQTSSGIVGFPFMVGQGHKNGVAFVPNTSSSTPITCGTPYQSGFGSPVAVPFVFMSGNKKGDSFASNHLATSTFTSSGTSSRPSYRPTTYDGPVSTSGGYRATSNVEKLVSISAMLAYNTISHEELRLEDYMTGKRGLGTNSSAVKSTSSGFPRCSSSPAKESNKISFPKITTFPSVDVCYCGDPSDLRRTSRTSPASTVSPVSFKPSCYFPFANPSTSPPNQSSFSSFSNHTFPLFTRDPKNAPVSSELSPVFNKPTTLVSPCVPSTQKCDEEVTGIIGQSSTSQLSSSHTTSTSSLANPFGTLPPRPQLSFECSRSTPIQYGIYSIPVKDKPAPVKYPLLTTRHISRGCKLPVRKYDPKSSVPFFLSEL